MPNYDRLMTKRMKLDPKLETTAVFNKNLESIFCQQQLPQISDLERKMAELHFTSDQRLIARARFERLEFKQKH